MTVVANAVTVNPLIQTCDIGFDGEPEAVEWLLPFTGPGSIDNSGLYSVGPMAIERYVLITAQLSFGTRLYEGYIFLPLPLTEFSQVFESLRQ